MIYVILFIVSFILTYIIKTIAIKKSLVDIPNERSSHIIPTPYGGGIAILLTWFSGLFFLYYHNNIDINLFYALNFGIIISLTGLIDDIFNLNLKPRLFTQFFVAVGGMYFLGGLKELDFIIYKIDDTTICNVVGVLGIVWFINLYNFIDGIDGYSGSEAVFLGIAGFILFSNNIFLILVVSVLGFLFWNWDKSKIFMGDVGSTLLGYNTAIFTIYYANNGTSVLVWLILFGVFWFDATITLYRRYSNNEDLSKAHKKHAYQRLTQSGWSHSKVTIGSIFVNIVLFCLIYFINNALVSFFISIIFLFLLIRYVDSKDKMIIPFHKINVTKEETDAVVEALKSGWLTMGPKTIEFEKKFKEFIECKESLCVNSATSALHLSLKAIGLKKDDEVIIPTNTFISTAEVITYFNAIPVLCDIEETTHNIDVTKIESLITKKTKAIIPVHFGGQPCDMDEISELAIKYGLKIIEDAAHAIPSIYKGRKIGNLSKSDITCFSFYATKPLSTGEGGMAVTNNSEYATIMKRNRLHGINKDAWKRYTTEGNWYYEVVDNGYKYNSTDLNTSLGLIQLKKQDELREKREKIAFKYNEAFNNNKKIVIPKIKDDRTTSWHLYVIKIDNRNEIIEKMRESEIACSVHFIPVHKHPYYKTKFKYEDKNYPVANEVFEKTMSLPIYPDMTDREIDFVIEHVLKFVG